MKNVVINGFKKGFSVTYTLSKVIFPITVLITILRFTPVLPYVIDLISPLMGLIGLPGEASLPLVLGSTLNLYAGIAAIISFSFTVKEVFILAVMLSFAHNLIIESTVAAKVGVRWQVVVGVRLALSLMSAVLIHWFVPLSEANAEYGYSVNETVVPAGWIEIITQAIITALSSIGQLAMIVIPLMVVMQLFRDLGWLDMLSEGLSPFMRVLGIKNNAAMTLVAGLTIGLAFGAGVMVQAVKDDHVEKKDMYLSLIFLVSCHAVIEDTLIFIPLGIPVWPLLLIRLTTAIVLTRVVSYFWLKQDLKQLTT